MDSETATWLLGAALIPSLGWGIYLTNTVNAIKRTNDRLVHMHEHPEEFGFGTMEMKQITKDLSLAIRSLTHYIRWMCEKQTGEIPPPPLNGRD